jgi:hypothetical protein
MAQCRRGRWSAPYPSPLTWLCLALHMPIKHVYGRQLKDRGKTRMVERIHILVDRAEKERYRRMAAREGKSLSEWLRAAAQEKLNAARLTEELDSPESLTRFFRECNEREQGRESDWDAHRKVIEKSIGSGAGQS